MRSAIFLFVLLPALLPGLNAASAQSAGSTPGATEWCGFHDKSGARVRCGFVSKSDCLHALDDSKDAVCMPDPEFAFDRVTRDRSIG